MTAYFDNDLLGGDPFPWVGVLSDDLSCQGVLATHIPREQYPFPATQFQLLGPDGDPPLRYVRTVSAGVFDSGRWLFEARGVVQDFEEPDLYAARLIRERFTRDMLIRYLSALGIRADDPGFYGDGIFLQEDAKFHRRVLPLEQARAEYTASASRSR